MTAGFNLQQQLLSQANWLDTDIVGAGALTLPGSGEGVKEQVRRLEDQEQKNQEQEEQEDEKWRIEKRKEKMICWRRIRRMKIFR